MGDFVFNPLFVRGRFCLKWYFSRLFCIAYRVRTVKLLWAVCISVGIVLLFAFPSALAVDTGEWYSLLKLPSFALDGRYQTIAWAVVYIADVAALSSLFFKGAKGARLYFPVSSGALDLFWCYAFFRLQSVAAGVVVAGMILLWTVLCAALNFKKDKFAFTVFCFKSAWQAYVFAVAIAIFCYSL